MTGRLSRGSAAFAACALALLVSAPAARARAQARDSAGTARPHVPSRYEVFPGGTLFPSLTASLNESQFRQSLLASRSDRGEFDTLVGHTEQGGAIGLFRVRGRRPGDGVELGIQAGVAGQFDLAASKWTLLNADYTFSYPLTWRRGRDAVRFRPYHVSSHLGDRYLLRRPEARTFGRQGFRREVLEGTAAHTFGDSARSALLYGGGEYAYSVTPKEMKRVQLRGGAEARRTFHRFGTVARGAWVVAAEQTFVQDRAWAGGVSVRTGLEVGRLTGEQPGGRRYRALLEAYSGPATYGHFSREDRVRYVGVGCYVIP